MRHVAWVLVLALWCWSHAGHAGAVVNARPPAVAGERVHAVRDGRFLRGVRDAQALVWSQAVGGLHYLRLYRADGPSWRVVAVGTHAFITSLAVGDVDGDGRDDIVVALRQSAKLDVVVRDRIHVYGAVVGRGFVPKWRGSALSRPFQQFALLPPDRTSRQSRACLVTLERSTAPLESVYAWVTVYGWNDFGFRVLWDTPVRGAVSGLTTGRDDEGVFIQFAQVTERGRRRLRLRPASHPAGADVAWRAVEVRPD